QTGPPLPWPVLYVRWPSFANAPFDHALEFQAGTNLILRQPNGVEANLTNFVAGAAKDPELSFDATMVIFAAKLNGADQWHVYEMPVAGGPMTQLTFGPWNDTDPHYLPGALGFVFLSNRDAEYGEDTTLGVDQTPLNLADPQNSVLWMAGPQGQNPKRLSRNLSSDQRPIVLKDGRIVWSRWERAEDRSSSRFPLFQMRLDGGIDFGDHQGIDELFGNHLSWGFDDPREMPNGLLVATRHYFVSLYRAGTVVLIDPDQPFGPPPAFNSFFLNLTPSVSPGDEPEPDGRYKSPRPLPDGRILLSWSPGPVFEENLPIPDFGLYVVDPLVTDPLGDVIRTLFLNDPLMDEVDALPVVPYATLHGQAEPDVIPPWTSAATTGFVGCADAGVGDYGFSNGPIPKSHGAFLPGDVKRFRFLKGIPIRYTDPDFTSPSGRQRGRTPYEASEVMGEIQLYADRSFKVEV
ncbi:MAG: TolB family protein, partial [Planctomycetota bacterium]